LSVSGRQHSLDRHFAGSTGQKWRSEMRIGQRVVAAILAGSYVGGVASGDHAKLPRYKASSLRT
jgi:hypothetical protein